jgi:hypothetical protein
MNKLACGFAAASALNALLVKSTMAKQVGEALSDMSDVQGTDPNGYTLMVISISILFLVASTLIGVSIWYMLKGKKKAPKP